MHRHMVTLVVSRGRVSSLRLNRICWTVAVAQDMIYCRVQQHGWKHHCTFCCPLPKEQ